MEILLCFVVFFMWLGFKLATGAGADLHLREKKRLNKGVLLIEAGYYNDAIVFFTEVVNSKKPNAVAFALRGNCYEKLGLDYNALDDYTKALNIDYRLKHTYLDKGKLLYKIEQYNLAFAELDKAVWHTRSTNAEALRYRGLTNLVLDRLDKAAGDFEKAVALGDEDSDYLIRLNGLKSYIKTQ